MKTKTLDVLKHALLDIRFLLSAGFDTDLDECSADQEKMDGVSDTIRELRAAIKELDPEWEE